LERDELKDCKERLKEQEDDVGITQLRQARLVEAEMTQEMIESVSTVVESFKLNTVEYDMMTKSVSELQPSLADFFKKLKALPDVVADELEGDGSQLAHVITEHMLVCFKSWDPACSLEVAISGSVEESLEAAGADVSLQEVAKAVAACFHHNTGQE
jgi:hypothetical protein